MTTEASLNDQLVALLAERTQCVERIAQIDTALVSFKAAIPTIRHRKGAPSQPTVRTRKARKPRLSPSSTDASAATPGAEAPHPQEG